ncbi:MAG: AAA family ATPase [Gordonia polyisoprenivorans]|nr:AAA family ATPase [Gordonia polyisoprenivorans]
MAQHPLSTARVKSFGPFTSLDLEFSPGLNVVIGENGAGKSQLIKLLYSTTKVLSDRQGERPTKGNLNSAIARKLVGVFRPEALGRLTNRQQGRTRCEVSVEYRGMTPLAFGFATNSSAEVRTETVPDQFLTETPAFIPTRELLSIYPGLVGIFDERALDLEETWRDTALLLARPVRRGPKEAVIRSVLEPISRALGGRIVEDGGRFYLVQAGLGNLEMHLVAEGFRKLGMIVRLVSSGVLLEGGYLFWDEPETNLNPKTLGDVAKTIVELSNSGVQVFVATHSIFLLREIELLTSGIDARPPTFIGLHRRPDSTVSAEFGATISDVGDIAALDAEFAQSHRYLELP